MTPGANSIEKDHEFTIEAKAIGGATATFTDFVLIAKVCVSEPVLGFDKNFNFVMVDIGVN
jgi:hypothetical protein